MKTIKSTVISIILVINLISCNTIDMWKEKSSYKESFKDFFATADGSKIVILGKRYHYIFDDSSGSIKQILGWNARSNLRMSIYDFEVDGFNKIKGSIVIRGLYQKELPKNPNENEEKFLENLGFIKKRNVFEKRIHLKGKRYRSKPRADYKLTFRNLNKKYKIQIKYDGGTSDMVTKIAVTPITITVDGVFITLGTALVAITMPLAIATVCIKGRAGACRL